MTTIESPVFADLARDLWSNACATAERFVEDVPASWIFGGSCWLWDARHPAPEGKWLLTLNRWAVSPLVVTYVVPAKVDLLRQQAEELVNAFPGTAEHLTALGCDHVDLLHRPIDGLDDVVAWTWSIFNACVPVPKTAPDPYKYPQHVVSASVLGRPGFDVIPKKQRGTAVLPAESGARTFWTAPSNSTT